MSTKNVLVTGVETPIGQSVVQRLLQDSRVGHILAVVEKGHHHPFESNPRLSIVFIKMRSQRQLHTLLFGIAVEQKIQVVVHTSQTESAVKEGVGVHAQNVESLRTLIDFAERHPTIHRLIFRSCVEVYQVQRDLPGLICENHPLNMEAGAPQWVRDRVEADCTACARMGLSKLSIVVLRLAEILNEGCGSQLFDYFHSSLCIRPFGFDPMLNFLSLQDAGSAFQKAIHHDAQGVFNIPGADSLPLSEAIALFERPSISLPEVGIYWSYKFRQKFLGKDFRYGMNRRKFHYSGILDGKRAQDVLGYRPSYAIPWSTFRME